MQNPASRPDARRRRVAYAAVALLISAAPAGAAAQSQALLVASGLESPLYVAAPPGDARLFIVERVGRIRVLQNGVVADTPFLDITDLVVVPANSEAGLLSLVFDPDYATNGAFYVFYVGDASGTNEIRVARFIAANPASSDPVDPNSEAILFRLTHPENNHFGGTVAIRGGFLYVGLGDGGGGGDPNDQSQQDEDPSARCCASTSRRGLRGATSVWHGVIDPAGPLTFDRATGCLYVGDVWPNTLTSGRWSSRRRPRLAQLRWGRTSKALTASTTTTTTAVRIWASRPAQRRVASVAGSRVRPCGWEMCHYRRRRLPGQRFAVAARSVLLHPLLRGAPHEPPLESRERDSPRR